MKISHFSEPLLLHHFSLEVFMAPSSSDEIFSLRMKYLPTSVVQSGLHGAFKANQSHHALVQQTLIELLLYARQRSTHCIFGSERGSGFLCVAHHKMLGDRGQYTDEQMSNNFR